MDVDEDREAWYEAMKAKGHMPIMETTYGDGKLIDLFVVDSRFHNGPGCEICHWSCCMHCESIADIPECTVMTLEPNK